MAKNTKPDLTAEMKMLNMTREQRRKAQKQELIKQGLAKRKDAMRKGIK